ncbi:YibE/F family protein [Asanoa iriomotensis]|uniref:Membrane protein n=1 Tax=Asanoa iriomotensis TaxID=234613 RepID=A0ABQ4BYT8_9ACTN|nr:YibE/F family protein [Asanoa iriomotensis]GIF55697.1 membrane protein [Asanoa iriomotensis]
MRDHPTVARSGSRLRVVLAAILVPSFLTALVSAVLLWPERSPSRNAVDPVPRYHATVTRIVELPCSPATETPEAAAPSGQCGTATVSFDDGPADGTSAEVDLSSGGGAPSVEIGDNVIVSPLVDGLNPEDAIYTIVEHQRGTPLLWLVAVFAIVIAAFGRWRGLAALAGLGVSFAVLLGFILPAILAGHSPLLVAVVGAALIMFVVLYLTHGLTAQTSVAVLGTLASLVLTGAMGSLAIALTHMTGAGDDAAVDVYLTYGAIDLRGLLLAGIIIGSLGVLDDVTVTQAATVAELARANPNLTHRQLYQGGIRVGRAHIASTVNTIVLAYAGASLQVVLLVVAGSRSTVESVTSEFVAQELVRTTVATLGLIAAVPITTVLAALVTKAGNHRPTTQRSTNPENSADVGGARIGR